MKPLRLETDREAWTMTDAHLVRNEQRAKFRVPAYDFESREINGVLLNVGYYFRREHDATVLQIDVMDDDGNPVDLPQDEWDELEEAIKDQIEYWEVK